MENNCRSLRSDKDHLKCFSGNMKNFLKSGERPITNAGTTSEDILGLNRAMEILYRVIEVCVHPIFIRH